MKSPHPGIVVTGASTGIGEACAVRLAHLGYRVFAGVRQPADGERLRAQAGDRLTWLALDVTHPEQVRAAAEQVDRILGAEGLAGLVNNAGIAMGGPLEFVSLEDLRQQLEVNVIGLLAVTQALLPALRRGRGRIVNMGSIAGRAASPFVGPYSASKHAVEALTDALRQELQPDGIGVSVIEPGAVQTPIWEKGQRAVAAARTRFPPEAFVRYGRGLEVLGKLLSAGARRGVPATAVANAVVHALEAKRPRTRYLVGGDAKLRALFRRLLPDRANDAVLRFFLGRLERRLG